jgi:hypothetical protein
VKVTSEFHRTAIRVNRFDIEVREYGMTIRFQSTPRLWIVSAFLLTMTLTGHARADHDEAIALSRAGVVAPIARLIEQASARYPGRSLEVESEKGSGRYLYEIEWLQDTGRVRKLWLNARTGMPVNDIPDDERRSARVP